MWRYAVARTTGVSHQLAGAPCQDRHAHIIDQRGLIIAVADGAGSACLADVGAEIAVSEAVGLLAARLGDQDVAWETLVLEAALAARSAVFAEADRAARSPRDYACTLLLIVLGQDGGGALQIGDGVIAYRDHDAWGWLFWPQKGEYANTTRFLIEDDAQQHFETTSLREPFQELAVMTDGLERLALHFATHSVHEPFLETVMAPLRQEQAVGEATRVSAALSIFLQSERIATRTDDDLTLILATRRTV